MAFNGFLFIGAVLIVVAAAVMSLMIYRYVTGMRAQGFFGGKKKDEEV